MEEEQGTPPKTTIYINFFDDINPQKVQGVMAVCTQLWNQKKPDTLYFMFSSPGGHVNAGITLYNFLKALPCEIVMHNQGAVDSVSNVIFMAGDRRYASPGTSFLFHGVGMGLQNNVVFKRADLGERLSQVEQDEKKLSELLASNSDLEPAEIEKLFVEGKATDVDFALEKGIIHEVRQGVIPNNVEVVTISFREQPK